MKNTVRAVAALHRVAPGNAAKCGGYALKAIADANAVNADLIVLPRLSLCGASCGDMMQNSVLLDDCRAAAEEIARRTAGSDSYIILSSPVRHGGKAEAASFILNSGRIIAEIPESSEELPPVFMCGKVGAAVISGTPDELFFKGTAAVKAGADIVILQCAEPSYAGYIEECRKTAEAFSRCAKCAVIICSGNIGETTSPEVYRPFAGIFECGRQIAWQMHKNSHFSANGDLDADILLSAGAHKKSAEPIFSKGYNNKSGLFREVSQNPFISGNFIESVAVTADYFELQVRGLAGRMKNAGIKKAVIGVSGGLDSTLALLVASAAFKQMGLDSSSIIGITMPGFGTSGRTYDNALALLERLKTDKREISIRAAATEHLGNIGHSLDVHDVAYENAQARERTQILFDVANMENAIVIGTGDLSEAALGWCTFGGDHISGYNVNSSITKTMARRIVEYLAQSPMFADVKEILIDILETPVSPELLPPENGEITQSTEAVLGAYELHDFYLYYFVRYGMPPSKIFEYARIAFEDIYSDEEILSSLRTFITRLVRNQFKRACAAEGCSCIAPVSLGNAKFNIPSDMSSEFLISELEEHIRKIKN